VTSTPVDFGDAMTAGFASRLCSGLVSLALCLGLGACSRPRDEATTAPQPTPPASRAALPRATTSDGAAINLELALTQEELATGLMFRPTLAADRGMLLLFPVERYPSIWMKNTLIDLDLVFLDDHGIVVDIIAGVPPCVADPCPIYTPSVPARAVLEIAAGGADGHGIAVGDPLEFERVPGYPVPNAEFGTRNSELAGTPP
jgi:uncharacterized membrane protein (UPF0127 family)